MLGRRGTSEKRGVGLVEGTVDAGHLRSTEVANGQGGRGFCFFFFI